ncbi:cysteine proteinase [Ascodesmis nigricans]|uniref:ubiquitinyl hydrolase 1 n=1 Tax=Ascodesmis nigricans TaxID=341454 RepID=A0A4S2MUJ7_9PEZI|nr:cysteine proteinase [Ascodesmis nigricans]
MVLGPARPGRSAPRLLENVLEHDPSIPGKQALSDDFSPLTAHVGHKHTLHQITEICTLPLYAGSPLNDRYTIASICEECRLHVTLIVDCTPDPRSDRPPRPCPTADNPLHFFTYCPSASTPFYGNDDRWEETRVFRCVGDDCPVEVTVKTTSPYINERLRLLLMDKPTLRERQNEFIQKNKEQIDPSSKIHTDDLPGRALETMLSYLKNAKRGDDRSIPRANKRYNTFLTDECAELFERAGFQSNEQANEWIPPSLGQFEPLFWMYNETLLLSVQNPKGFKSAPVKDGYVPAISAMKTILRCKEYESIRPRLDLGGKDMTRYYAALGILPDFSDQLVIWAFKRQILCDVQSRPYLLESLENISHQRGTEVLQIEVATQRSQGAYTSGDAYEAARRLGITNLESAEEGLIIGLFKSRLADSPRQEYQLREDLSIIGRYRNSTAILEVAQQTSFPTAKSACDWLTVPEDTEDSMILSMYAARVAEFPGDEAAAKAAVRKIGEYRNSSVLLSFVETGLFVEAPPDIGQAFATLGVEDRTMDDDTLITVFGMRYMDMPGQVHDLRNALRAIGTERNSKQILDYLSTGETATTGPGSSDSPVGLENIGNTCYLNSLLQFYFTIKPLREMILNLEAYEETDVNDDVVDRKRVGGRKVSRQEIERAKKFAGHLRTLFQDLIATKMTSVAPQRDLAYLALVSSKDEEAERRKSVEASKPETIDLSNTDDAMDIDTPINGPNVADDAVSEDTLVGDSQDQPSSHAHNELPSYNSVGSDYVMVDVDAKIPPSNDKESLMPLKVPKDTEKSVGGDSLIQQTVALSEDTVLADAPEGVPLTPPPDIPERPPPIPPRPQIKKRESSAGDLMFGRQQDVTECIGNVMFQLESAIRPTEIDSHGEQMDLIKEYFYGTTKQTLTFPNSEEIRTKEELFNHLIVNVAESDEDIYSALDSSFDVEQVDLEGRSAKRFLSLGRLPPILQIQVQRVQFDREKGSAYKAHAHLNFPETIFMDRYMDTDTVPDLKERREKAWEWKQELKDLLKRKIELTNTSAGVDVPTVLDAAKEMLEDYELIDPSLATENARSSLQRRLAEIKQELSDIAERVTLLESQLANQFADLRSHGYRIHSVFIHRGTVSFGHYWIYIYDFQRHMWRKYNDERVTEVIDPQEIFTTAPNDHQPPTPYFLVFIREDQAEAITEAVKREIGDSTPPDFNLAPLV